MVRRESAPGWQGGRETQEAIEDRQRAHRAKLTGTRTSQPIKDTATVARWLRTAREHDLTRRSGVSWYLLLLIGFNTGLRISDIVRLRVRDIRGHERLVVVARKTGREADIKLKADVRKTIDTYLGNADPDEFIFRSRERGPDGQPKPIDRRTALRIVQRIAAATGYTSHVGTHTMRKTYAYALYIASGRDLSIVQHQLGHSSTAVSLHYIGLDRETTDAAASRMPSFV